MKNNIIYHSADLDGWCSGAITRMAVEKSRNLPIRMIPWDYGEPIPELDGPVYMTDISFPPSVMKNLAESNGLVWIDHHASAIKDSEEHGYSGVDGVRKVGDSASLLAWRHFFGHDVPDVVKWVDLFDVWKKDNEFGHTWDQIMVMQYGMRYMMCDPSKLTPYIAWCENFKKMCESLFVHGTVVLDYLRKQNEIECKRAFLIGFHGLKFLALNHSGNSETFKSVATPEHDGLMMFKFSGNNYRVSLYRNELSEKSMDLDLSVIAKRLGGGGHAGACGFEVHTMDLVYKNHGYSRSQIHLHPGFLGTADFKLCLSHLHDVRPEKRELILKAIPDGWSYSNHYHFEENPDRSYYTFTKKK